MNGHWETGRTEAFSYGLPGIARTLLVLDTGVPRSHSNTFATGRPMMGASPDFAGSSAPGGGFRCKIGLSHMLPVISDRRGGVCDRVGLGPGS
jgi:hypothetical protein